MENILLNVTFWTKHLITSNIELEVILRSVFRTDYIVWSVEEQQKESNCLSMPGVKSECLLEEKLHGLFC